MSRFRRYGPHDEQAQLVGDPAFSGVNTRQPRESLPPGVLAGATNNRCRRGVAGTRNGRILPGHLNRLVDAGPDGRFAGWGTIYGTGRFADPNGTEWIVVAAEGRVFVTGEGRAARAWLCGSCPTLSITGATGGRARPTCATMPGAITAIALACGD